MLSPERLHKDQRMVEMMVTMYCRVKHGQVALCAECRGLIDYAHLRLSRCPHGEDKPMCHNCTIHCYKPEMRERITAVMKTVGPRMVSIPRPAVVPSA